MLPKLIRVTDQNEGSICNYTPDGFRSWVCDVFMEGYKRYVEFPTLERALEVVRNAGCSVEIDPTR
jgi:hypothetical protein